MTPEYTTHLICAPEFEGDAHVRQLHAAPGALVGNEALLLTLQSASHPDQTLEIRAPCPGVIDQFVVAPGDLVESAGLLLIMEVEDDESEWLEVLPPPVMEGDDEPPTEIGSALIARSSYLVASLPAAGLAARLGVDLATVAGSGPRGEIEEADVERHVRDLLSGRR